MEGLSVLTANMNEYYPTCQKLLRIRVYLPSANDITIVASTPHIGVTEWFCLPSTFYLSNSIPARAASPFHKVLPTAVSL